MVGVLCGIACMSMDKVDERQAPTQDALWSAWGILKSLESVLQPLIAQDAISDPPDFSRLQSMADQSRSLAVNSLRHVGHRMEATGSTTSLLSGTTAVTFASDAEFARKSRFNVHNVCDSALVYRENSCSFHDVAYLKTPGDYPEWSCKRCNMTMSRVQLQLSAKSPDNVWMSPSGLFKAHCTLELSNGLGPGWTCIWQKVSRDCYLRFGRQRDLLKHMKDVHVSDAARGEHTNIDWPADSRNWNAETCGYGATIGGKAMQDSRESFVIPAS